MLQKKPLSYLEISKKNLIYNFKQFKGYLRKGTLVSAVIKSNAYGHGDIEVVKVLSPFVDYFQVNSFEELKKIKNTTNKPILVFGYVGISDMEDAIRLGCILSVFDSEHLSLINKIAQNLNKKQKVHIVVDSFLGREGIMPETVEVFIKNLLKMKNIIVDGIYSHFANIEDTSDFSYGKKQVDIYENIINVFEKYGFSDFKKHISATSGVMVYEKNYGNNKIVRIGIGLYGLWPSKYLEKKLGNKYRDLDKSTGKISLKPVLSWKTHIAQVKVLPMGYFIGYGLTYKTNKEMKVAVIPQGYADGFSRELSNKGNALIGGTRCSVLGRVAMNMFVVDVSHLNKVKAGDEVVILGQQKKENISIEEMSEKLNTINYEIVARINPLLPRIIV
ncbi:MAG: alanine racemase [Candidatus Paceibacterota bacterium]